MVRENPYDVVCDRVRVFEKIFFVPKIDKIGPETGFFEFQERFGH